MKKLFAAIICLFMFSHASGQAFSPPVGIATVVGPGVYNLTPTSSCGSPYYGGAFWCTTTIDFTNSFVLTFKASFDHAVGIGADGICVAFGQNITPTSMNGTSAYLGYYNVMGGPPNPDFSNSFGVEFDIFDNTYLPYFISDMAGTDHTAICANAVPTTPLPGGGPVAISPSVANVKDGTYHDYKITWCPLTHTLQVFYNDTVRLTSVYDYGAIFTTPTAVHWGFSGGTGLYCSNQLIENINLAVGTGCGTIVTVCDSVALPDSLHPCIGDVVTLPAALYGPDSVLSIIWTPVTGLSGSTILNPTLTATSSGWYYITVQSIIPYNLVVNGDFSAGNSGFTSSYIYSAPPSSVLNEGYYSVYTDPYGVHTGFTSMGDHTTGTGNMMILNGGPTPTDVWCQTISVTPNTDYDFSAWIANCSSITVGPDVPILQFKINGVLIGAPVTISTPPGTWMNFFQTWNSGVSTSATICIYDLNTSAAGNDFAIDDISFRQLCTSKDSIFVAAAVPDTSHNFKDTGVCILSSPITLNAPGGYSSYTWSNSSTGTTISATTSGVYWVTATAPCRLLNDTFNVSFFIPDTTSRQSDTTVCASVGTVTINAPSGYTSYLWNTGAATTSISVANGKFWVQASKICTILVDTIKVKFNAPPPVELGNDTSFCKGNTITLTSAEPPGTQYSWSTGSTAPSVIIDQAGTYYLTVTLNGCTNTDTIKITEDDLPVVDLGPDTFLCKGDQMYLSANAPNSAVVWSSGSVSQNITVIETGTYWVTVSTSCGDVTDSINVEFDPCDINFPSAFTPNGDGKNDVIRVLGYLRFFRDFSLSIYNRWGQRVYFSEDIYGGWDGVFNGTKQELGTYFYMIKYSLHSKQHMLKGDFQLIR